MSRQYARALQQTARLVERQPWKTRMDRRRIAVAEIAQEVRLHVALGKELLIAAEARFAGGEELLVHLRVVEAGHRPAVETERARGEDQIRALQARVALRRHERGFGVGLKQLPHSRVDRKQFR